MNISNRPILLLLLITFIAQYFYSQVVDHTYKSTVHTFNEAWNTGKVNLLDEVYGDEKAAINFTVEATPKETGKKFISEGIVIFRFRDGKIIEDHSVFDQLSALRQQGYKIIDPE